MRVLVAEAVLRSVRAILAPTRGARRRPQPEAIKRLLLVNRLRIGDSVVTTPFLAHVRSHLPGAEITLLVQPPIDALFRNDPRVDVLAVRRKGKLDCVRGRWAPGFDAAVILDPTLRSGWIARRAKARWVAGYDSHSRGIFLDARLPAPPYWNRPLPEYLGRTRPLHQTQAWLELAALLGLPPAQPAPWLAVSDEDRGWAAERLAAAPGKGPLVALHPGSDPAYLWPVDRWGQLAAALVKDRDARLVVTGGPGDRELAAALAVAAGVPVINLVGEMTLGNLAAVLAQADAVVSVDTCATHIASAVGTPCVALFGAGDPDIWRPYGEGHIVLRIATPLPCLGCKRATCALPRHECMLGIEGERVLKAVDTVLARGKAHTGGR